MGLPQPVFAPRTRLYLTKAAPAAVVGAAAGLAVRDRKSIRASFPKGPAALADASAGRFATTHPLQKALRKLSGASSPPILAIRFDVHKSA